MHGNRHTDDIGYQHQVTVGMGLVGAVFPFQNQPEHQRRAERRECIDLTLDGRKPKCVAPGIHKRPAKAGTEDNQHLSKAYLAGIVFYDKALHKVGYSPEKQQYGACRQQCRHGVDHQCRLRHVAPGEINEETRSEHENRVARRVTDLEFRSLCYKLGTVPEACRRFHRKQVGHSRHQEAYPSQHIVNQSVSFHCMHIV